MAISNKDVRFFRTDDHDEDAGKRLDIFQAIKNGETVGLDDMISGAGVSGDLLASSMEAYLKKGLVEIRDEEGKKTVCLSSPGTFFLGVEFDREECTLAAVDMGGRTVKSEKISLPGLKGSRGRVGEIKEILKEVSGRTEFRGTSFRAAGLVVTDDVESKGEKVVPMLAEGLSRIFRCDVTVATAAAAAAYGEREKNEDLNGKDILYMYTDSGDGVVIKGEAVLAKEGPEEGPRSYLRPWVQFNAVKTAKELVNKGLGTDIVGMVKGDIDSITMADVLDAGENNDELADDLVKRSALAMGVRSAYLINIFDVEYLVLGGGIEKKEGNFAGYVGESMERFLLREISGKVKIIRGVLGEGSYCEGAALLCRRELFMEG